VRPVRVAASIPAARADLEENRIKQRNNTDFFSVLHIFPHCKMPSLFKQSKMFTVSKHKHH